MRIFIFILSLIFSVAFVLLNVLGFNGVLTLNEFFLVNVVAEVLVCLVLGHFMFRTYANHKKLKKLQQELTTRQASTVAQEQTTKKKRGLTLKKNTSPSPDEAPTPQQSVQQRTAPHVPQQPTQQPVASHAPQQPTTSRAPQQPTQQPDPRRAPVREQAVPTQAPQHTPVTDVTQPMQPIRTDAPDMDSTALYNTPFGK